MATLLLDIFAGKATLAALALLLFAWVLYRVGGKHIDEIYEKIRKRLKGKNPPLSLERKVDELSRLLAESHLREMEKQKMLDEVKEVASRSLALADRSLQDNIRLKLENSRLIQQLHDQKP